MLLYDYFFRDGKEIAVAYYRSGYVPDHYPTENVSREREQKERNRRGRLRQKDA